MNTPKFSIVVPVYNVALYLRECLDSIVSQTFKNWECICTDDGSSDLSGKILDEYRDKDSRFKIIHQSNFGVSRARNVALDMAVGEWLCFVDSDDKVDENWLLNYSVIIDKFAPTMVHIDHQDWLCENKLFPKGRFGNGVMHENLDASEWLWSNIPNHGFALDYAIKRDVVGEGRFPIGVKFAEDALFAMGWLNRVKAVFLSDYQGYYYRQRSDSAVRQKFDWIERNAYVENWISIKEKQLHELPAGDMRLQYMLIAEQSMLNSVFFSWLSRPLKWIENGNGQEELFRLAMLINPKNVKPRWRMLFLLFRNRGFLFPLQFFHNLAICVAKLIQLRRRFGFGKKKIVILAHHISYNMGGLATITRITAREFANRGYNVEILTRDYDGKFQTNNCIIRHNPSPIRCMISVVYAEYVICEGAIFRLCWPLLFLPKKCIVVRHMVRPSKISKMRELLEKWLSINAVWAGVSGFVAEREQIKTVVVPNACDPAIFFEDGRVKKYDLAFVGAIHSYKGADLLFDAIDLLSSRGVPINRLTLVGEGELMDALKTRLKNGLLGDCEVVFTGNLEANGVAEVLRDTKVIVVPTRRKKIMEAFGCVAIEGASCGCIVIASDNGGLPEATGPCGVIFKSDDCKSLADAIEKVVTKGFRRDNGAVSAHLRKYTPENLVNTYLNLLDNNAN